MSDSFFNTLFKQVRSMAKTYGTPDKPRAILREYLQAKALYYLYSQPGSEKLSFMGGTSLHLLRNLPRFSEDLDFDNLGLNDADITNLVKNVVTKLNAENIKCELNTTARDYKHYYELKFTTLLQDLDITANPREKLMIKVDYSRSWSGQTIEHILLNRYGVLAQIPTNSLDQLLVQKMSAYVGRSTPQPRDIYDIVWLYSQGARLDEKFMQHNKVNNLLQRAIDRSVKEEITRTMKAKLEPFVFGVDELAKLDLFDTVLLELKKLT